MNITKKRTRAGDSNDSDDHKRRAIIDTKTFLLIMAVLTGSVGTEYGLNVFNGRDHAVKNLETKVSTYIKTHAVEENLREINLENKLDNIQEDVKEIKQIIRNGQ